jgi:hypothetical protein
MDAQDREKAQQEAIEKMLGEALRHGSPPAPEACPEPDHLAAYFEQTLSPAEKESVESHISDCSHCQEVVAALAASALEPSLAEELVMSAATAATAVQPHAARVPAMRAPVATSAARNSWFTLHWRWLAPAVSLAAVALLWFAIGRPWRPPTPIDVALKTPPAAVPPPLPAESTSKAEPDRLAKNLEAAPHDGRKSVGSPVNKKSALDAIERKRADTVSSTTSGRLLAKNPPVPAASPKISGEPVATPAPPQVAVVDRSESAKIAGEKKESREANTRLLSGVAGKAVVAPPPAAPSSAMQKTQQAPDQMSAQAQAPPQKQLADAPSANQIVESAARDNEGRLMGLRKTALASPQTISTPDPLILWRVGRAGKIERTNDGQTWQAQSSGVSANLTSGSAPSIRICWVVGSAGVILRTTDGEHWEKIAPPAPLEWIRIVAEDAQRAIVTSVDLKQFVTTDGGKTWLPH